MFKLAICSVVAVIQLGCFVYAKPYDDYNQGNIYFGDRTGLNNGPRYNDQYNLKSDIGEDFPYYTHFGRSFDYDFIPEYFRNFEKFLQNTLYGWPEERSSYEVPDPKYRRFMNPVFPPFESFPSFLPPLHQLPHRRILRPLHSLPPLQPFPPLPPLQPFQPFPPLPPLPPLQPFPPFQTPFMDEFRTFSDNHDIQQQALDTAIKAYDVTSNQASFNPNFVFRFPDMPQFPSMPPMKPWGHRNSGGNLDDNSAFSFGAVGPDYQHQIASISPNNPSMPNVNVFNRFGGADNNNGRQSGFKSVSSYSSSISTNMNGKPVSSRVAETVINNNGKVVRYKVQS